MVHNFAMHCIISSNCTCSWVNLNVISFLVAGMMVWWATLICIHLCFISAGAGGQLMWRICVFLLFVHLRSGMFHFWYLFHLYMQMLLIMFVILSHFLHSPVEEELQFLPCSFSYWNQKPASFYTALTLTQFRFSLLSYRYITVWSNLSSVTYVLKVQLKYALPVGWCCVSVVFLIPWS